MSGYDRSRVVGMSEHDLDEFTCGICQGIFNNPVVTKCCRHHYCFSCIDEWLSKQNTCPYDRQQLASNELTPAPRLVLNLLNNMKIKCDYEEKGCDFCATISELVKHLDGCPYKPDTNCKICELFIMEGEDHDCIATLKAKNTALQDKIQRLREKTVALKRINEELPMSMSDVLKSAQNHFNDFVIDEPFLSITAIQQEFLIKKCREVILNNDDFAVIARSLSEAVGKSPLFGGKKVWQAIVFSADCGETWIRCHQFFRIRFDKLIIELFTARDV